MNSSIRGRLIASKQPVEIEMQRGVITRIEPIEEEAHLPWVSPGFIDHQVNGFGGYDANDKQPTPEIISGLARELWKTGVTRFCPTIITNHEEGIIASLRAIVRACAEDELTDAAVAAIHVEGPFISPHDGPRGAHRRDCVRPPDWDEFQRWQEAADGRIGIVTLSPEWPEASDFIQRLSQAGIIASIGHTAATPEQIQDAVKAGATFSTHLGNGAHLVLPRHPNYIWEQLASDELWAGLILDGHHLPPAVAKTFIRAKGLDRCVLTTDAVSMAGLPPGNYQLNGVDVQLTEKGRIEVVGGGGLLAGSALEMPIGIVNAMRFADVSLEQAVQLATTQPAKMLGLGDVRVRVGNRADLTLFYFDEKTQSMEIRGTYVQGQGVYSRP